MKEEQVLERVYDRERLATAWRQVKKNAGAAGIDGMTVEEFQKAEEKHLGTVIEKLKAGHYRFKPARRVLIEKPGTKAKRKIGIPVVLDRIVSQSINRALAEIFEREFTESNYGFREGHSQQRAIGQMRQIINEGYGWVVSIDLKSFFDEIPHGLILKLIRRKIRDERLVTLIARALKAGVIVDGKYEKTEKGTPQGSPLSPILSNIVLNELDQELERRGHKYVRWADDFLIFVKSERAAQRVKEGISHYIKEELELEINEEKSGTHPSHEATFLGFQIWRGKIKISTKAKKEIHKKIKGMTTRNNPISMSRVIERINEYLKGWIAYFRIQEFKRPLKELDNYIRTRLRSIQLKKWKNPKKFQRIMIAQGCDPRVAHKTWVNMRKWKSALRRNVSITLNPEWFRKKGLFFLADFTERNLEFKFRY